MLVAKSISTVSIMFTTIVLNRINRTSASTRSSVSNITMTITVTITITTCRVFVRTRAVGPASLDSEGEGDHRE